MWNSLLEERGEVVRVGAGPTDIGRTQFWNVPDAIAAEPLSD
jgi:hypothetical protein